MRRGGRRGEVALRWPEDDPRGKFPHPAVFLGGFWLVTMCGLWLSPRATAPLPGRVAVTLWLTLVCGGGLVLGHFKLRRDLRQLRRERGLCLQCGYDLRATPGSCPECGAGRDA